VATLEDWFDRDGSGTIDLPTGFKGYGVQIKVLLCCSKSL
jgi:hypothetical protein